jgi:predicted nucleotidyltransferase
VREQLLGFVSKLSEMLGSNLVGVFLHGSLAMGCFNPHASDIDVLVITQRRVGRKKIRLASLALAASLKPCPIEVTTFSKRDLNPWRYPTPFDFHFSEDWRTAYESDTALRRMGRSGEDPAAHLAETRARGVVLLGPPIESVLPTVPVRDFLDSVVGDFRWALRKLYGNATIDGRMSASTYLVLNACRILSFLENGRVLSKAEGGDWALGVVPQKYAPVVRQALHAYRHTNIRGEINLALVRSFATWLMRKTNAVSGSDRSEKSIGS